MSETLSRGRAVESAALQYVETRGKGGRLISTAAGARALRAALSGCAYSDRELAQMIAEAAIRRGCNVHFDRDERPEIEDEREPT